MEKMGKNETNLKPPPNVLFSQPTKKEYFAERRLEPRNRSLFHICNRRFFLGPGADFSPYLPYLPYLALPTKTRGRGRNARSRGK